MMRFLGVVTTGLLIGAALLTPAYAADELGVSRDGNTWSDRLPGSLFDSSVRWVPGDTRTESFFLRNQASDRGDLRIVASSTDPDRLLRDDEVSIEVRIDEGEWQLLDGARGSITLDERTLDAGDRAEVAVRASFDPASGNQTRRDSLSLAFAVTLSDASVGGDDDDDGDGGLLPDTGARIAGWTLIAAAVALGSGLALMRRRSKEREVVRHG